MSDDSRWTTPSMDTSLIFDEDGNVVPDGKPPEVRDRLLAIMEGWDELYATGNRDKLVELGILPPEED